MVERSKGDTERNVAIVTMRKPLNHTTIGPFVTLHLCQRMQPLHPPHSATKARLFQEQLIELIATHYLAQHPTVVAVGHRPNMRHHTCQRQP